ncbi:hypothetical protein [uncultured Litoreibacter sp.]|uniref:hypothetical protein n=1 Tax=uncultured Litoreibacter sp. TaxID=1392394 RepID=UPI002622A131|nr:hypothetical protein [uncultured Litoreibacter sp.]
MFLSRQLIAAGLLIGSVTQGMAQVTQDEIRNGFREHAVMAQFHRWYQLYERPAGGIDNALDILTSDVVISSGLGTANGHDEYASRVAQLPDTWRNAHFLKSAQITHGDDGAMNLSAQVTYQNEGLLPDGAVREAELTYTVSLAQGEGLLPLLSNVKIEQNSESQADVFEDAYAENRMRSLVHYWLALIEDPARNAAPVQEILAEEFSLNFSSGAITDFAGFEAWLAGPGSQVSASTHILSNFSAQDLGDDQYSLSVDFDWAGITPDGVELVAKTRHNWTATNDVTERFARIKTVDVEVLEPFRPREN